MSPFLQTLLACTLTMSAVIAVLLLAAPVLVRRYSAGGLYLAWIVVLIGLVVPFRPTLPEPVVTVRVPVFTEGMLPEDGAAASALPITLSQALLMVWGLGAVLVLGWHLRQHRRFLRVVRRWSHPLTDARYEDALYTAAQGLGIHVELPLFHCEAVDTPLLVGLWRPHILLPDLSLNDTELDMVLRHELVHYRRGDLWIKQLILLAKAMHWFNPLVYAMARAVGYQCEAACDAEVTRDADLDARLYYSETIISVIRRQTGPRTALATSFYGGKEGMRRRILAIMDATGKRVGTVLVMLLLILTVSAGAALAVRTAVQTPHPSPLTAQPTLAPKEVRGLPEPTVAQPTLAPKEARATPTPAPAATARPVVKQGGSLNLRQSFPEINLPRQWSLPSR